MMSQMKDRLAVSFVRTNTTLKKILNMKIYIIDVRNWFSNIEQHATEGVNKILIGNKCDMEDKRVRESLVSKKKSLVYY